MQLKSSLQNLPNLHLLEQTVFLQPSTKFSLILSQEYQLFGSGLNQGWATSSIGWPYVGRRSPSRAELLNGSSSISSTTTIVRVAQIESKKKSLHILRCTVFLRKRAKKVYTSSDVLFCTENIGEAGP